MNSKTRSNYYVYAFLRAKDSPRGAKFTPYYIGKGSGNRAFRKNRKIPLPADKTLIVFVEEGLSEDKAFSLEQYCIRLYGRVNNGTGMLHNLTDGGEGTSGRVQTKETRAKISSAFTGEKHPMWGRTGKLSPNWGRKHSDEARQKMSRNRVVYNYLIVSPSGQLYETDNLSAFCRDHDLRQPSMTRVALGRRTHYKGWKIQIIDRLNKNAEV